jgi:hypothetical protein
LVRPPSSRRSSAREVGLRLKPLIPVLISLVLIGVIFLVFVRPSGLSVYPWQSDIEPGEYKVSLINLQEEFNDDYVYFVVYEIYDGEHILVPHRLTKSMVGKPPADAKTLLVSMENGMLRAKFQ